MEILMYSFPEVTVQENVMDLGKGPTLNTIQCTTV